jgi:hypothetical protein
LGVAPVWLSFWDGDVTASGFVHHADTIQGRESGKTDIGPKFDRVRFISSLEDDMNDEEFERRTLKVLQTVGLKQMDDGGNEVGPIRTTANWIWRLRELVKLDADSISAAEVRAIAKSEDDKLKVTK